MDAPIETKKRGPGRPRKDQQEDEVLDEVFVPEPDSPQEIVSPALVEPLQMEDIKHAIRTISLSGDWTEDGINGPHPKEIVEDSLRNTYLNEGYVLFATHHVRIVVSRDEQPIGHEIMYVFVKYAQ